jgi:hypothetical protein
MSASGDRIRRHLAGELVAEEYINVDTGRAMVRVPFLGEVNANEQPISVPGHRPIKLVLLTQEEALVRCEEKRQRQWGSGLTVIALNRAGADDPKFALLSHQERDAIRYVRGGDRHG